MLLLNIQSSPRGAKSASIAVTNAFLDAYRALHSDVTIDTLNVWQENLPDFDQEAIGAKYNGINKEPMDPAEAAVWNKIQKLALRFQQAARIVLGVPMWNFAYPYLPIVFSYLPIVSINWIGVIGAFQLFPRRGYISSNLETVPRSYRTVLPVWSGWPKHTLVLCSAFL